MLSEKTLRIREDVEEVYEACRGKPPWIRTGMSEERGEANVRSTFKVISCSILLRISQMREYVPYAKTKICAGS